jgi:aryl-alcohol dehydrogenase-like predicted oxidoreductase
MTTPAPPPPTVTLNGQPIAPLGIGTWAWGDSLFWSYGKDYGPNELEAAFMASLAAGITLFDTAEVYGLGESERLVGRFAQKYTQTADRPLQLATKYMPLPWRWDAAAVTQALTDSLQRLQVGSVDLYQVHQPFSFLLSQERLMKTLATAVQQGKIKAVGVSNYSAVQMREAHTLLAAQNVPLAVNQVSYSLLDRKIERNGILDTARDLDVLILAYSPLAQGLLTGKYGVDTARSAITGARQLDPRFSRKGLEKIAPVVKLLQEIGETYDRTPAQVALNWLIAQGGVIPIPGAKTAAQVQQNAGALGWQMDEQARTRIDLATRAWQ